MNVEWNEGLVDALTVTVLMDDTSGMNSPYLAQHGVAFLIECTVKEEKKRILFDTGAGSEPLLANMKTAGIDPASVDMIILSHCHYDHTGGLEGIVRAIGKSDLPIVAHPGLFRNSFITEPFFLHIGFPGANTAAKIESLGGRWVFTADPMMVATGILFSGEIQRKHAQEDALAIRAFQTHDGRIQPDHLVDDVSLYIATGKGLVVITGCAHAGIINILDQGMEATGRSRVYSVIGGFHLTGAADQRIDWTIRQLQDRVTDKVYSGHCTGLKAEGRMLEALQERYKSFHSGKVIRYILD